MEVTAAIEPLMLSITHYLVLSVALLVIGLVGALLRRNLLVRLFSIELILSAAAINLAAFARLFADTAGQSFAVFEIAIAGAGALVLLAIIAAAFSEWQNREIPQAPSRHDALQS
jgi:NADH-quinone oxidoreductase subunit K